MNKRLLSATNEVALVIALADTDAPDASVKAKLRLLFINNDGGVISATELLNRKAGVFVEMMLSSVADDTTNEVADGAALFVPI